MAGAAAAGLDIGVYVYSYDRSAEAAHIAAEKLHTLLSNYGTINYPVWFDIEDQWNLTAGKQLNTQICQAFLSQMELTAITPGFTALLTFCRAIWIWKLFPPMTYGWADYRDPMKYPGPYGIWQHGIVGQPGRFWAGLYDTRPSAGAERKL